MKIPESDDIATQTTTALDIDAKALHFMLMRGIYNKDLQLKMLQHLYAVGCVTHLWRKGLSASALLGHVYYIAVSDVVNVH